MSRACLVCDALHLEMINIYLHPRKLSSMLRLLLGLQATSNNYLCTTCCDKVINAFDSELNCQQSKLHSPKVLKSGEVVFKNEINPDPDETKFAITLSQSEVKVEPKSEHELDENFSILEMKLRERLETNEIVENRPEFSANYEDDTERQKINLKKEFKIETPDVDLGQNYGVSSESCMSFFKKEKSVEIETGYNDRESFGATVNINYSAGNSERFRQNPIQMCTKEKLFACNECGKTFTASSSLTRHKIIHTGERPHECPDCGKCFAASSSLNRHKIIHTGEKPYKCPDCGKCYTDSSGLTRHKSIHTGELYTCTYCTKTFGSSYNFRVHLRTHTQEKPYICSECGKTFTRSTTLNRHKKTHTRERPFVCS